MMDEEGRPLALPVTVLAVLPTLAVAGADDELLRGDDDLELLMDEAEMHALLEGQPAQSAASLESQPDEKSATASASQQKSVQFEKKLYCREFVFGDDRLGPETVTEKLQWPEMERAKKVPKLMGLKAKDNAMWRERMVEMIKKQGYRQGVPLVDERLRPLPCQKPSVLKVKTHEEPRSGPEQRVFINNNDDMTWNFLAKLRHPPNVINSRSSSPVPPYLKRRAVIACRETLSALLIHQFVQDGAYEGRALPRMNPTPVSPSRNKRRFPLGMTGREIREAKDMSQAEINRKYGQKPRSEPAPSVNKDRKRPAYVLEAPIPRSTAQRVVPAAPPKGKQSVRTMQPVPVSSLPPLPASDPVGKKRTAHVKNSELSVKPKGSDPSMPKIGEVPGGASAIESIGSGRRNGSKEVAEVVLGSDKPDPPKARECEGSSGQVIGAARRDISPEPLKSGPLTPITEGVGVWGATSGVSGRKRTRRLSSSSSSSTSSSSSSGSEIDLSKPGNFGRVIMRGISRRCIRYVQSLEVRLQETVAALNGRNPTKEASTQTDQDVKRVLVFDRLN